MALKRGFESSCQTDAVLFIYCQHAAAIRDLRQAGMSEPSEPFNTRSSRRGMPQPGYPVEIFFSYAHHDEDLMNDVRRQLIIHERNGRILKWHDRMIPAGSNWRTKIDDRLRDAHVILLFISPHFIESEYCYEGEGRIALDLHRNGNAVVIPVIMRPCSWTATPFAELQALPKDARPVSRWADRDEACLSVAVADRSQIRPCSLLKGVFPPVRRVRRLLANLSLSLCGSREIASVGSASTQHR